MATTLAGRGPPTRRRRVSTITWRALTYLALILIMAPAAWLLHRRASPAAWSHWQWSVLWTQLTPTGGGLRDQILGTLILMVGVFIIAGTIGVLAGIHLAELARPQQAQRAGSAAPLRTASDILSGFPSIVLGYVGYMALVVGLHWGFSLLPAADHPVHHGHPLHRQDDRELAAPGPDRLPGGGGGARACPMGYGLRKVVLKSALPGIVTGLLLALAIACGETAPLIYTAGFSNTLPHSLTHAAVPLPDLRRLHVLQRPEAQNHYLAYDAALILVVIVLLLLVASRIVVARTQRHSESARGAAARHRRPPAAEPEPPDGPT